MRDRMTADSVDAAGGNKNTTEMLLINSTGATI
jgi:hypothetical protein